MVWMAGEGSGNNSVRDGRWMRKIDERNVIKTYFRPIPRSQNLKPAFSRNLAAATHWTLPEESTFENPLKEV